VTPRYRRGQASIPMRVELRDSDTAVTIEADGSTAIDLPMGEHRLAVTRADEGEPASVFELRFER
jgi:hypothetical protein